MHSRIRVFAFVAIAMGSVASNGIAQASMADAITTHNDYSTDAFWLCRPGRTDACSVDLSTTVISAHGEQSRESWKADPNAPIDCFYVYPTVSAERDPNSSMAQSPSEINVIHQQFARFGSKCRTFAPMYRQVTLAGLGRILTPGDTSGVSPGPAMWALA